jgi:hypothetical protein
MKFRLPYGLVAENTSYSATTYREFYTHAVEAKPDVDHPFQNCPNWSVSLMVGNVRYLQKWMGSVSQPQERQDKAKEAPCSQGSKKNEVTHH